MAARHRDPSPRNIRAGAAATRLPPRDPVPRFAPTFIIMLTMTLMNGEDDNDSGNDNEKQLVKSNGF